MVWGGLCHRLSGPPPTPRVQPPSISSMAPPLISSSSLSTICHSTSPSSPFCHFWRTRSATLAWDPQLPSQTSSMATTRRHPLRLFQGERAHLLFQGESARLRHQGGHPTTMLFQGEGAHLRQHGAHRGSMLFPRERAHLWQVRKPMICFAVPLHRGKPMICFVESLL